ncbi:NAD-dependent succinate-semialdehyde dehydrogenase [Brevundimonas sp.]|uniref:NAD-dependent succinate-semialdehyde dehydrogenase n=1 Tax=Brevundimonas sp. TaxID=1871086 RepID=UPI003D0EE1D3
MVSEALMSEVGAIVRDVPRQLLIGGAWREAASGARFAVLDPATGRSVADVADGGPQEAILAMEACVAAQADWSRTPARVRSDILLAACRRMLVDEERLARLMTLEMGKSLAESRGEVRYAADFLRWFAEEAVRLGGQYSLAPDGSARILTTREPVGPCILVTPWNFPLAMGTRKIGPAIAAGCTMIVKPAQQTPLSMLALAAIFQDCGLPAGVLNVVTTRRAAPVVTTCMEHPAARKVSFTGSTNVGRRLAAQAGDRMLRMSMELGGDNPFLVFADADLDAALDGAILAKMRNIGEACTAANRFLIEESVADDFARRLADRMGAMTVGPGLSDAQVGPLIDAPARDRVAALVRDAVDAGADVLTGGFMPEGEGFFYPPTVLTNVPAHAEILNTEVFGPVATIQTFRDEAEAIDIANATTFGLAAYVYTRDLARGLRVTDRLQVGMVGLNRGVVSTPAAPFGGIKASGIGREGGREGVEEYLSLKYASIAI